MLRVLLVEDCAADAELVVRSLRRSGLGVEWGQAQSAAELGALLEGRSWDVVVADFSLPQFGAMAALVMVQERELDIPFIVVSGVVGEEAAVEAMRAGAQDFVTKDNLVRLAPVVEREVRGARERRAWREALDTAGAGTPRDPSPRTGRLEWFLPLALTISLTLAVAFVVQLLCSWAFPSLAQLKVSLVVLSVSGPVAAVSIYYLAARRRELMQRVVAQFVEQRRLNEIRRQQTERTRELELKMEERQRRERHLKAQHTLTRIMAGSRPTHEALAALLRTVCQTLDWDAGEYWTQGPAPLGLKPQARFPLDAVPTGVAGTSAARRDPESLERICRKVASQGKPAFVADLHEETPLLSAMGEKPAGFRSSVAFPVRLGEEFLGVMVFISAAPRAADPELIEMLEDVGSQIGQFIERRRAEAALQQAHEELESRVSRRTAELASLNEALGRSEANLRQAQQIARLGSFEAYPPFRLARGTYWSEEACRILGLDPLQAELSLEEFIDRMAHPEDRPRLRRAILDPEGGREASEIEHRVVRPDGAERFVRTLVEPCLDSSGGFLKMVGTLHDVTERKQLEKQVLEASENEQRRIGQDLHDDLCQHLAGIEFMSQALHQRLEGEGNPEAALAFQVAELVRGAINQTRALARGLSPVQLEARGLTAALHDLAEHAQRMFHVRCRLSTDSRVEVRSPVAATHLYRIAQEAIHNAVRHGKADRIEIDLRADGPMARFRIDDNGAGFAPASSDAPAGMGLRIMQYRAGMIGASLQVQPGAGGGVSVECTFRIQPPDP